MSSNSVFISFVPKIGVTLESPRVWGKNPYTQASPQPNWVRISRTSKSNDSESIQSWGTTEVVQTID